MLSGMKTTTITTRVDPELKVEATATFDAFGITLSEAISIFLHKAVQVGGLPFDVRQPRYDAEVEAAMREVDDMLAGRAPMRRFSTVDDLIEDFQSGSDV